MVVFRILNSLVLGFLLCFTVGQSSYAQEQVDSSDPEPAIVDKLPKIVAAEPEKSFFQVIDGQFKSAVDLMNKVLFYRLGRSEREYIVFERSSTFYRPQGSKDDLQNLDPNATDLPSTLNKNRLATFEAQGKLKAPLGPGTLDGQVVEFVTVKQNSPDGKVEFGDKFVYRPETEEFQILEKKRSLPGDLIITQDQVEQWHTQGFLKTNSESSSEKTAYLLSEPVGGIPVVVAWLALGGVYFTLFMRGFNFWGFRHAVDIVRGKYDNPDETGEVTHFQALASALSATIGLGNIAGVTIAMTLGGPGAFFWMLFCGLFGMCSKFTECTLGQKYRHVKPDGSVLGGPMRYLKAGLEEMNLGLLGAFLSIVFAVMCILASFGGGNMLQANQSGSAMLQMFQQDQLEQISGLNSEIKDAANQNDVERMLALQSEKKALQDEVDGFENKFKWIYGVVLAALVGAVIIGGIKRIGAAASKIVPSMCVMYSLACLYIILTHLTEVPELVAQIFTEAFSGQAMGGGIIGVLVVGVQRAAFSNEAGAGSAAIAHSAAKTEEPIREGCVALLGPFIDTIIVCSMTALVILITGAWDNSQWTIEQGLEGAALTSRAFKEEISWFPYLLSIAVTLFAYSTIISWSYYGEKAWEFLFGARSTFVYKILAVIAVFVGTVVNLGSVLDFSDMMILGMAFPNIAGVVLLSPKVRKDLQEYWKRYQAGEFQTYK